MNSNRYHQEESQLPNLEDFNTLHTCLVLAIAKDVLRLKPAPAALTFSHEKNIDFQFKEQFLVNNAGA